MARADDCGPCRWGNHDQHDRDHGILPGLIGGTYCACTGDCAQRAETRAADIGAWFNQHVGALTTDPPGTPLT
jgi:hypothetical protein